MNSHSADIQLLLNFSVLMAGQIKVKISILLASIWWFNVQ